MMARRKDQNKYLVVGKNEAVRAKWPYGELEQKIAILIISVINPTDLDFSEYTFRTAHILKLFNMGEKNYDNLYQATENLLRSPISIKTPEGGLYQSNIISEAYYPPDRSTVTFSISKTMKHYLLQLQEGCYTKFFLENIIGLNSKYAIAMYRFCKSYEVQRFITKPIEDIKFSLGIEADEYENFYDFNKWVLMVAQKELEKKTDLKYKYEAIKRGKKVVKLKFTISPNRQLEQELKTAIDLKILAEMDLRDKTAKIGEIQAQIESEAEKRARVKREIRESLKQAEKNKQPELFPNFL